MNAVHMRGRSYGGLMKKRCQIHMSNIRVTLGIILQHIPKEIS